jgi:hypothetical protein
MGKKYHSERPAVKKEPKFKPKLRHILGMTFLGLALSGSVTEIWRRSGVKSNDSAAKNPALAKFDSNGWPLMLPPPPSNAEVWECEVAIVGGSLGGTAAAYHSMKTGVTTCTIELTTMMGGQISSQGVSAIDESLLMRYHQVFSASWTHFKNVIASQPAFPPKYSYLKANAVVADTNSCWVGNLCFTPTAGASAAEALLNEALLSAPKSRWGKQIAFKGVDFSASGDTITAVYGVRRKPRNPNYIPLGRLSRELVPWYSWESTDDFEKVAIKLQPPAGKQMIVIDATDTGELVAWANIPHRVGAEGFSTTGETHAVADNPECTQAFTFPFILKIFDDKGESLKKLRTIQPGYSKEEHRKDYDLGRYPAFVGNSFFNYRRIVSILRDNPFKATPAKGDMTVVNWNRGNDWGIMNPPLIMTNEQIDASGQRQNWMGGLNFNALKEGENHALLFSEWLMDNHATSDFPLTHLSGIDSPMPTESGLSLYPYIREGRRILGRSAYGQTSFYMREQDLRKDMAGGRDFRPSVIGITHYAIDMHGCRYRNWEPSKSPSSAPVNEDFVKPIIMPLESLIPLKINNLLIGGKGIAVSHIVNGATRIHVGEWAAGAASGATAAWIVKQQDLSLTPQEIIYRKLVPNLQKHLISQGIVLEW